MSDKETLRETDKPCAQPDCQNHFCMPLQDLNDVFLQAKLCACSVFDFFILGRTKYSATDKKHEDTSPNVRSCCSSCCHNCALAIPATSQTWFSLGPISAALLPDTLLPHVSDHLCLLQPLS